MKARRVKGLTPKTPLGEAARRSVRVRFRELRSFVPEALSPEAVDAQHDMRIAAKRLRYLLEVMTPALGAWGAAAAKSARDLQDVLGEIHDCDVMLPRVEEQLQLLSGRAAPHDDAYRGLAVLAAELRNRRARRFDDFRRLWDRLERQGYGRWDRVNDAPLVAAADR